VSDGAANDGLVMVALAQWGSAMGLEDAQAIVFSDDYDPESASADDEPVRKILMWGETVATMVKHDLFPENLLLDWIWVAGLWSRVRPAAYRAREHFGEPRLYENFEALAERGADR
jgi:hypothetical protein